ncbi:hypothetical protein niasHS_006193 [Heterodera schachtii]|uniref:Serpentine receptor class gamma n=1 Tax=Heterodera schachtii TaxID=97005 RepID=A0ABD2JSJ9_HETSC
MDNFSNWIISNATKFYCFSIILSVPSIFLYIGEMFAILKSKETRANSFYRLFCVRGISDILMMAASCYGNRLPSLLGPSLLPIYRALPNWTLALFYFLTTFTYQVTNIATLFMLLNRFTAIAFPLSHKKFWKKLFWLLIMAMLAIPSLTCYPIMQMHATLSENADGTFLIMEPKRTFLDYSNQLKSLTSVIFLILCFFVNLLTLIAYKRYRKAIATSQQSDNIERKLLIYSLLTFAGHALLAVFFLSVSEFVWPFYPQYNAIIYIQYPWVTDLCTLVLSSWLLLCTSDKFRHQLIGTFLPKRLLPSTRAQNVVVPLDKNNVLITVQPYHSSKWAAR